MRVVFDTNIMVAGFYSKRGASYPLIKAALSGELPVAVSPLIALEYEGVLHRKIEEGFLQISEEDCGKILSTLFAMATIVWRPLQIRPVLSTQQMIRFSNVPFLAIAPTSLLSTKNTFRRH